MSLELLINKTHYAQFLEKTNPCEHKKAQEHLNKYQKYKPKINKLLNEYVNCYSSPAVYFGKGSVELQEIFSSFAKKAVLYFESIEDNEDDADQLFDSAKMKAGDAADDAEEAEEAEEIYASSINADYYDDAIETNDEMDDNEEDEDEEVPEKKEPINVYSPALFPAGNSTSESSTTFHLEENSSRRLKVTNKSMLDIDMLLCNRKMVKGQNFKKML